MKTRQRLFFEVSESPEELLKAYRAEPNPIVSDRIRALWFYKTGQCLNCIQLAQKLGRGRHTIERWMASYQKGGMDELRNLNKGGVKFKVDLLAPEAQKALDARLSDPRGGFNSYPEMQRWLLQQFGISITITKLYYYCTTRFKLSFKRPRKSNVMKAPDAESGFKKLLSRN